MPDCNRVLTKKNTHVIGTIPAEPQMGYKRHTNIKPAAHGGHSMMVEKHKYRVCSDCYVFWNMDVQGSTLLDDPDKKDESMDRVDKLIEEDVLGIGNKRVT
jgi:hypothetical protein